MRTLLLCFFTVVSFAAIMQGSSNAVSLDSLPLSLAPTTFKPEVTSSPTSPNNRSSLLESSNKTSNNLLKYSIAGLSVAQIDPLISNHSNTANATINLESLSTAIKESEISKPFNVPLDLPIPNLETQTSCSAGSSDSDRLLDVKEVSIELMRYDISKKMLILHCKTIKERTMFGADISTERDLLIFASNIGLIEVNV